MKSNRFNLLLAIVYIFTFLSLINAQTTISIRLGPATGQDVYIGDNYLNINWGIHPDLIALAWTNGGVGVTARSLFQFDLSSIPANSNIVDAKLSLFGNPTPENPLHEGPNETYIRRVTSPWLYNTLVWDTHPDFTHHNQVLLPQSSSPTQDYLDINVTDLVEDMLNNPTTSFGFILMLRIEHRYRSMNFASSECTDTSKRPLLEITYDNPLPVELSSFSSTIKERNVVLNWSTSTEENNRGFEILYSKLKDNDWVKVGFIEGAGNSNTLKNYSFEHKNLSTGKYKYRLKQIDYNGNFKNYDLSTEIEIGVPKKFSLSQNYPNPFNPSTLINYDIAEDSHVSIKIFDMTGRELRTLVNDTKNAGYYSEIFSAAEGNALASGAYFYRIEATPLSGNGKTFISNKNMILVK